MSVGSDDILKISVVMATYNGARYLREQLDSIVGQSYPVCEIIVQDDGSTDGTLELLREYAALHPLVKVYANESGRHGVNTNFFSAMERAVGDYIAISDQDDIWVADKLRWQAEAIGDKLLCSGFSIPFSTDGFPVRADMRRPNLHLLRGVYLSAMPGHTMLISKRLLQLLRGCPEVPYYYDWQLSCVAEAMESVVFVDKELVHFRRHAGAATATMPVGDSLLSQGAWNYVTTCLLHHPTLQREVRRRFAHVLPLLESLPSGTPSLKAAIEMSRLQVRRGLVSFCRRVRFFVRHRDHLFYAHEPRPLVRYLRALFFVYSCGYYYRGVLNKAPGKQPVKNQPSTI